MSNKSGVTDQVISLPKGGGALKGIGEKFSPDLFTGTGNFSVPITVPPGRNGFQPELTLAYSTGHGNGPLGLGWALSIPGISRKTAKGVPKYDDEADIFILSGAEDLVPVEHAEGITRYRPRTEGLFARIERHHANGTHYWKVFSKDGLTSEYGTEPFLQNAAASGEPNRIADPNNRSKIFAWKLTRTLDPFGNRIEYEYEHDLGTDGPHEWDQLYLKRIRYVDYHRGDETKFLVSMSFHYDDRPDPFSEYRPGFEIRTRKRCSHIEIRTHPDQHCDDNESGILVRTYHFIYFDAKEDMKDQLPPNGVSLLKQIKVVGHDDTQPAEEDRSEELPPLEFSYTPFDPTQRNFFPLEGHLPSHSLANPETELADLFGNGLPDILEMDSTVRYWRNLGNGRFDFPREMQDAPAGFTLADQGVQLIDANGNGLIDLLVTVEGLAGFYPMISGGMWDRQSFQPYEYAPSFNLEDPEVRLVDLDGDGVTDAIHSGTRLECYFNDPQKGWSRTRWIERQAIDEFPNINFSDPRVKWGDMSGDGLQDVVLIHDGNVEYWPNLGHGNWAKRISMLNCPRLPYGYDPKRILVGDVDGDGLADIVYVDNAKITIWINQSGNSWSDPIEIKGTPPVSDMDAVRLADMLGNGISGILWSQDRTALSRENYYFLDLTGECKPYLLNEMDNNMGAVTRVKYVPSTRFYLEDQKDPETRWKTPLPFPTQVVSCVEVIDLISEGKLSTQYTYHHGYWDGEEREFRGFGRVDQRDTEFFEDYHVNDLSDAHFNKCSKSFYIPPIYTRTWFHTGSYFDENMISNQYEEEYFPRTPEGDPEALFLPDTCLPDGLTLAEKREACRSLKGRILRQEIYALDQTAKSKYPYSVSERNYGIMQIRPMYDHLHAVNFAYPNEQLDYSYERNPNDPRISHQITLKVDRCGNVTDSVTIGYPRRIPQFEKQGQTLIVYTKSDFINKDQEALFYYVGIPYQSRTYEITGLEVYWNPGGLLGPNDFISIIENPDQFRSYHWERPENHSSIEKRIIEWSRTYFRRNIDPHAVDAIGSIEHRLPLGELESLGLIYESYQVTFNDEMLAEIYPKQISDKILIEEGGYHAEPDLPGYWWNPSGRHGYSGNTFYLPDVFQDPFGNQASVRYDVYGLLMEETKDPLDNRVLAYNDYRTLQPWQVTDPNNNSSQVAFDALGLVVGTAVMGKEIESKGDSLREFRPNLDEETVHYHINNPLEAPHDILQCATTRLVYDINRYRREGKPNVVYTLTRETHDADLAEGEQTKIQHSFLYSDGLGRELQTKTQAEPGSVNGIHMQHRWVSTGLKLFNNKGKPIRQFEPFFSDMPSYGIEQHGISPYIFYDPLERVVATLHPNHSYEKVVFDSWQQITWDQADTITQTDPQNDPDVGSYFIDLDQANYLPTWYSNRIDGQMGQAEQTAALQAAKHAETPVVAHLDTLGRGFLTITPNIIFDENMEVSETVDYCTQVELDIENNQHSITDALGRLVVKYKYDLLGNQLYQKSMDAEKSWILLNVAGNPILGWQQDGSAGGSNSILIETRHSYDKLQRATHLFRRKGVEDEILVEHLVYGEDHHDAAALNLRGQVYKQHDSAGILINEEFDFKGNLLKSRRQLLQNYSEQVNWNCFPILEDEVFAGLMSYDALDRPIQLKTPDNSMIQPKYNEANLLERVDVWLRGSADQYPVTAGCLDPETADMNCITNITYNAKGQRKIIEFGNGVNTQYDYDLYTFRMSSLITQRSSSAEILQNLSYTYDPVGNITQIQDDAQQAIFFNNAVVKPTMTYEYDSLYQLVCAQGREHIGQVGTNFPWHNREFKPHYDVRNSTRCNLPHPNDGQAMRSYRERYVYDPVGNILQLIHIAANDTWIRRYEYAHHNNRLLSTNLPGDSNDGPYSAKYSYDSRGNMISMPNLREMQWDFKNQLQMVDLNGGGKVYFVYDSFGQRIRKVRENQHGVQQEERIYLGAYEIYRKWNGNGIKLERETVHIMDDQRRLALIETKSIDENTPVQNPRSITRYQFANHIGSSNLELDDNGDIISFEEYYPFGNTSYQSVDHQIEASQKRYRYTGKERDEESGLYYFGARYYVPWLGRWTSCDQAGLIDGLNIYLYTQNNPIRFMDQQGAQSYDPEQGIMYIEVPNIKYARRAEYEFEDQQITGIGHPDRAVAAGYDAYIEARNIARKTNDPRDWEAAKEYWQEWTSKLRENRSAEAKKWWTYVGDMFLYIAIGSVAGVASEYVIGAGGSLLQAGFIEGSTFIVLDQGQRFVRGRELLTPNEIGFYLFFGMFVRGFKESKPKDLWIYTWRKEGFKGTNIEAKTAGRVWATEFGPGEWIFKETPMARMLRSLRIGSKQAPSDWIKVPAEAMNLFQRPRGLTHRIWKLLVGQSMARQPGNILMLDRLKWFIGKPTAKQISLFNRNNLLSGCGDIGFWSIILLNYYKKKKQE